jgi:hypothetical protein
VLFVDEAYQLLGSDRDFGIQAIEELMRAMNEPPGVAPVMIFCGYKDSMDRFLAANAGMSRRVGYIFDFQDYTCAELARIFCLRATMKGFDCAADATEVSARAAVPRYGRIHHSPSPPQCTELSVLPAKPDTRLCVSGATELALTRQYWCFLARC